MSAQWIPSRVLVSEEFPEMLDTQFALTKQRRQNRDHQLDLLHECNGAMESTKNRESGNIVSGALLQEVSSPLAPVRINHRAQIDVLEMGDEQKGTITAPAHVLVYEEQHSKLVVLRSLKSDDPSAVARKLVDIVTTIGAPRIIQSGNGRSYAERVVREIRRLLRDFCVVHGDGTRTSGEERRDFRLILKTWMNDHPGRSLKDALRVIQVTENTKPNLRNGAIPSQLFFGRNICEDLCRTIGVKGPNGSVFPPSVNMNSKQAEPCANGLQRSPKTLENLESMYDREQEIDEHEGDERLNTKSVQLIENKDSDKGNEESDFLQEHEENDFTERNGVNDPNGRSKETNDGKTSPENNANKTNEQKTDFADNEEKYCSERNEVKDPRGKKDNQYLKRRNTEKDFEKKRPKSNAIEANEQEKDFLEKGEKFCTERNKVKDVGGRKDKENLKGRNKKKKLEEKSPNNNANETNDGTKEMNIRSTDNFEIPQRNIRTLSRRASKKSRSEPEARRGIRNSHLECTYCKQVFNFPSVLKRHMRSHTNERPYVCELCDKSFKQLGHLSQHSLTHTDYRSFRCDLGCSEKFDSLESLKIHSCYTRTESEATFSRVVKRRETLRLFECDICKKIFATKSVLERHVYTHTHERKYACKICGKKFKQAGHVKSHMLVHTGERKYSCEVCARRFSLSNSLKKHMYVHNGDKPYQCDVCGSRFLEKRNLNGHLMTHTNERPHSCKICGKRYTLADTLRRHVSATHEDGRTYQCEICAKMFKQLAHLSVHKKVHNDERPFQCHLCDKNFKHKNVLKSHLAVHANVRPFECDVCKATFVRKTNLQTHIASAHMNERPYPCTICNKRFKQISHLNGHIVVHSNSMPYQCDFCDRRCNRLDNLKKHMRLHTKDKE